MIINRHNYEEFFLLYVDNELKNEEKKAVEKFISENHDLAKEFENFQQATLADTKVHFNDKELLYKKESNISLFNYEEFFLLSVDKELSGEQAKELEVFLWKNPKLRNEYQLLNKTVCVPRTISFPQKEILYREEKQRRIVPLRLTKISAAAVITGLAIVSWFVYNSSPKTQEAEVVAIRKPVEIRVAQTPKLIQTKPGETIAIKPGNENGIKPSLALATNRKVNIPESKKASKKIETSIAQNTPSVMNADRPTEEKHKNRPEEPAVAEQTIPTQNDSRKADENPEAVPDKAGDGLLTSTVNEKSTEEKNVVASHAVYRIIDTDEEEDKNFHIGNTEINKVKLKGLFKKAASFIEKRLAKSQN